jgi:hypothetical protein
LTSANASPATRYSNKEVLYFKVITDLPDAAACRIINTRDELNALLDRLCADARAHLPLRGHRRALPRLIALKEEVKKL